MNHQTALDMSFGSPDREAVWKARPLRFKAQHRWNVLSAFITGDISARACVFGLRFPAAVVHLALKQPQTGIICVCPEFKKNLELLVEP